MSYAEISVQRSALYGGFTSAPQQRAAVQTARAKAIADPFAFAMALMQGIIYGAIGGSAVSALVIALVLGLRQLVGA